MWDFAHRKPALRNG